MELTEGHERWITDEEGEAAQATELTPDDREYFQIEKIILIAHQEGLAKSIAHGEQVGSRRRSARIKEAKAAGADQPQGSGQGAGGGRRGGRGGAQGAGKGDKEGEGSSDDHRLDSNSNSEEESEEGSSSSSKTPGTSSSASRTPVPPKKRKQRPSRQSRESDDSYSPPAKKGDTPLSSGKAPSKALRGRLSDPLPKAFGGRGRGGKGASRGRGGSSKGKSPASQEQTLSQLMAADAAEAEAASPGQDVEEEEDEGLEALLRTTASSAGAAGSDNSPGPSTSTTGTHFEVPEESAGQKKRQRDVYRASGSDAKNVMVFVQSKCETLFRRTTSNLHKISAISRTINKNHKEYMDELKAIRELANTAAAFTNSEWLKEECEENLGLLWGYGEETLLYDAVVVDKSKKKYISRYMQLQETKKDSGWISRCLYRLFTGTAVKSIIPCTTSYEWEEGPIIRLGKKVFRIPHDFKTLLSSIISGAGFKEGEADAQDSKAIR